MNYWPLLILLATVGVVRLLGMLASRDVFGKTIGAYARIWRYWDIR